MHGQHIYLGNTNHNRFLLIDFRGNSGISSESLSLLSQYLCNTPMFDDLIDVFDSEKGDVRMRVFGGDGREAAFCGNGALFTLSALKKDFMPLHGEKEVYLETLAGIKKTLLTEEGDCWLNFGEVKTDGFFLRAEAVRDLKRYGIRPIDCCLSGEPHLVLWAPKRIQRTPWERHSFESLGRKLFQSAADFEGGVNVTMVFEQAGDSLSICTFERGVRRMTASCGTGALAAVAALYPRTKGKQRINVISPGGQHQVMYHPEKNEWWLSGEVRLIGEGELGDICDLPDNLANAYSLN